MREQGNPIGRAFSKFVSALNTAGGVLIFAIIVMINLDVFSRFLFNHPIDGVTELVELSIVAIVFLQLSDAVRNGRLTRSDSLYKRLCDRNPKLGHLFGIVFEMQLMGAWIGMVVDVTIRAGLLWWRYSVGNWTRTRV